jgi:hypothetical protein
VNDNGEGRLSVDDYYELNIDDYYELAVLYKPLTIGD